MKPVNRMNHNLTKGVERTIDRLIREAYPELGGKYIPVNIKYGMPYSDEFSEPLITTFTPWFGKHPFRTVINGRFPLNLIRHDNYKQIIRGCVSHELAHIANGDHSPLNVIKGVFRQLTESNSKYEEAVVLREKRADDTLIARGLGKDYLVAVRFILETFPGMDGQMKTYPVDELERMTA